MEHFKKAAPQRLLFCLKKICTHQITALTLWRFICSTWNKKIKNYSKKYNYMNDGLTAPTLAGMAAPTDSKSLLSANLTVLHTLEYSKIVNIILVFALVATASKLIIMLFSYLLKIA